MGRRHAITRISARPLWSHIERRRQASKRGNGCTPVLPNLLALPACFLLHTPQEWCLGWGLANRQSLLSLTSGISRSSPPASKLEPPDAGHSCPQTRLWAGSIEHRNKVPLEGQRERTHAGASAIWQPRQVLGA